MRGESCVANSFDTTVGSGTAASQLLRTVLNKQLQDMFGPANSVFLQVGTHYIMTTNVDMTDRLVNGALGTLHKYSMLLSRRQENESCTDYGFCLMILRQVQKLVVSHSST